MKPKTILTGLAAALLAGAAAYGFYQWGMQRGMRMAGVPAPADDGRRVLYWHDPMVPGQKFDKPGKSPFMDMQLVPVYAGSGNIEGGVSISSRVVQNLGVRTAEATRGMLAPEVEAVGSIAYNERDVAVVQARSNGFVERLHVRAPLDAVRKGQLMAELYVPDWVAAQEEYLSAQRLAGTRMEALVDGARQRMRLAGMNDAQIRLVESSGRVHPLLAVVAPIDGVVAELGAREGMTVMAGAPLFRINGLDTVWVNAEVPEAQAAWLVPGSRVQARVPAYPERQFAGHVGAILPEVNPVTRTLRARIELSNPGHRLKPGMFATLSLSSGLATRAVLVPSEAVIRTGERSLVVLAEGGGKFRQQDVELGIERAGSSEIRKGLKPGDKVVLSGQFLLDSEASLKAGLARLEPAPATPDAAHAGRGKVMAVDIAKGRVELDHEPIPSMQWPRMQMGFTVRDKAQLSSLKPGAMVEFEMRAEPDKDGGYVIEKIRQAP